MFKNKKILITGGTGSLGVALTKKLLKTDVSIIRIFSRDEWKQTDMASKFTDKRLRFLIGDIRDKDRLYRAMDGIDIVIHTAALKHVPVAEYNPFEAVKTNIHGAQNIIDCCLEHNVETVLAISTDKAVSPLNTYGATKLLMERLFISANFYKGEKKSKFFCVRYGNVLSSRGSVVPKFIEQILSNNSITITDSSMTRFNITMEQSTDLVFRALRNGVGGEIFIPKLKAYRLKELLESISELLKSKPKIKKINVRPGEKFHESLIGFDEIRKTYENKDDYVLLPESEVYSYKNIKNLSKSNISTEYSSNNVELLKKNEIKQILQKDNLTKKLFE